MKWLVLLTLVVACSTTKKEEPKKVDPASAQTESKPASPLTVANCFCMKMFQPVCADGINYGNSCEAECHGHKKWTQGNCPKK